MISAQDSTRTLKGNSLALSFIPRAANYKTIIQMLFPSTIYKNLKYSEEKSKKNPHMQQNEQDSHFAVVSSTLITDL